MLPALVRRRAESGRWRSSARYDPAGRDKLKIKTRNIKIVVSLRDEESEV